MLDRIRNLFGFQSANLQRRLTSTPYGILPIVSVSGQVVTPENLLTLATVYQCVYVLASGVASVNYNVVRFLPDGGKVKDSNNPIQDLISIEPNSDITARSMYETIMVCLLTFGNAYLLISRNDYLEPTALYVLDPRLVKQSRNPVSYDLEYIVAGEIRPSADVIHVAAPGSDGISGFQPINHLSNVVGVAKALEDFAGSFFARGCNARGIINVEGELSAEALERLRKSFEAVHAGTGNGNALMILEEGMKYQSSSATPNEAQFVEAQKLQMLKIAQVFNLPPTRIGIYDHTALNTLEESNLDFFNSSLYPWVDRIVQAFNKKLFPPQQRRTLRIEHEEGSSLKGRMSDQIANWQMLKNMGILSTNEIRSKLGLPGRPGGDALLVQANNYAPLDQVVGGQEELGEI